MKSFISLEEAIYILNHHVENLKEEQVSLVEGIGKIVAENIYSTMDSPPFNKSAMDGYAVGQVDTKENLRVIDTVFAGGISEKKIEQGEAIRIMTGAMIPEGALGVIKQEEVDLHGEYITLNRGIKIDENICFKGEDIKKGQLLIEKNKKINYADLGILASCGVRTLKVYRKPRVALITTGDEVIDVEEDLREGKIYNSNKYTLLGRLRDLGYEVTYIDHGSDNFQHIGSCIEKASEVADFIFTTGGASVGEKDLIDQAINHIRGEILFWKVLIKPGSAMLCSKVNSKMVISLSGNPTAALTTFELLGRTALEKLSGSEIMEIKREKALLTNSFNKPSPQRRFLRGRLSQEIDGVKVTITQVKSGNGILSSALNSDCLIEIPKGTEAVKEGQVIDIIRL